MSHISELLKPVGGSAWFGSLNPHFPNWRQRPKCARLCTFLGKTWFCEKLERFWLAGETQSVEKVWCPPYPSSNVGLQVLHIVALRVIKRILDTHLLLKCASACVLSPAMLPVHVSYFYIWVLPVDTNGTFERFLFNCSIMPSHQITVSSCVYKISECDAKCDSHN